MPRLTILMPAYNAGRFIGEAVESLLHQTFTDFELWLIDDASTDQTLRVVSNLRDPRLHIFTNPLNKGRDALVNEWVEKVSTQFFTITDADDVSHPMRLQKQMEILEGNDRLLMCGSSYAALDEKGFVLRTVVLPTDPNMIASNVHKHAQFHGPTTIMRKEVLTEVQPFYRSGYFEADADTCCRILIKGRATNCAEPLYFYRVVRGSMSRQNITANLLNSYKVIHWLYRQRLATGTDVIESNDLARLEEYLAQIEKSYTPDALHRHTAFYHLYWRLTGEAISQAGQAVLANRLNAKNMIVLFFIIFQSGLFYLNRAISKKHYTAQLTKI